MTTNTEALRAQFEQYVNPDGDVNMHWLAAGYYASRGVQQSWLDFQAGHAAAKAETADVGEPAAWMAVVTHSRSQGPQAHFVSDAKLASSVELPSSTSTADRCGAGNAQRAATDSRLART